MPPYERYAAWQHSHQLVLMIYRQTATWPKDERFGLIAQVRRAAVSVPSNLVEGAARDGARPFRLHLDIAKGSMAELGYQLRVARDLGYVSEDGWKLLEKQREIAAKTLWGLYRSVRNKAKESG